MEPGPVTSRSRGERWLLVLTPAAAMTAVALGLRFGASGALVAAEVRGAPPSGARTGLAWQIVVFREERGAREPVGGLELDAVARAGDAAALWNGKTDEDGVAEALFALPAAQGVWMQVRAGRTVLAEGACDPALAEGRVDPASASGWLPFARREGAIALDVAVLGHWVGPGFPAELWVRATDAATRAPLGGVAIDLENDSSLARVPPGTETATDSRGWAVITAVPAGLAVTATLRARSRDARTGEWIGGLYMSPGAAKLETRRRWEPAQPPEFDIVAPTSWPNAYIEVDDGRGRAWAAAPALVAQHDGTSSAAARAPALAPGLYWAIVSEDPTGAAALSAGTIARPFFVASTDEAALAFGTDREACVPPPDPRETSNALSSCLALSSMPPVPRGLALDGFARAREVDREARAKGRAIAVGALVAAMLLEAVLLFRAATARAVGAAPTSPSAERFARVAVAVLVGLLGFALLAAFIARASGE